MKKRQHFPESERSKRLCDLAYTNIRVHPTLISDGPFDEALFIATVRTKAREVGAEQCVRDFLKALRLPYNEWASLIPIHPSLMQSRDALMGEEEFIHIGVQQIEEIGVVPYFKNVIENLSQGTIPMTTGAA